MKKFKVLISTLLAGALLSLPACKTNSSGNQIDPQTAQALAPVLASSVAGAVVYAYTRDTNSVIYVAAIRTALNEFLISTNLSGAALQATLYNLPIPQLKTPEAQLIMAPLIGAYKAFADKYVKAGIYNDPSLQLLVQSLIDGLDSGLTGVKAIQSSPLPPVHSEWKPADSLKRIADAMTRQIHTETPNHLASSVNLQTWYLSQVPAAKGRLQY
jgi:hypothetical protein